MLHTKNSHVEITQLILNVYWQSWITHSSVESPSIISLWSCVIFKNFSPLVLLRVPIYNKGNFNVFRCFIFLLGDITNSALSHPLVSFSSNFEYKIFFPFRDWLMYQICHGTPTPNTSDIFCLNSITWILSSNCK